jgi:hypothetical protein
MRRNSKNPGAAIRFATLPSEHEALPEQSAHVHDVTMNRAGLDPQASPAAFSSRILMFFR